MNTHFSEVLRDLQYYSYLLLDHSRFCAFFYRATGWNARAFSDKSEKFSGVFNLPALEREHGLDEPGDAGRGLEVPQVRLHRAEDAGLRAGEVPPQHALQPGDLDRVAERRPGPVALDLNRCCLYPYFLKV